MVIKSDGRRQVFDRNKLLNGLIRSCDKLDISMENLTTLVDDIERELRNTMEQEVSAQEIGALVMEKLKALDEVAYIRFASVYKSFGSAQSFLKALQKLK